MPIVVEGITSQQLGRSIADWVKDGTVEAGYRALRQEVDRGFDNQPVVVTDGVPRRAPEAVKPFGKIEFIARSNMADIVMWALNELWKASPVRTRRYINSHTVMINGVQVGGNLVSALRAVKPGDRVQIVNPQPYARKLEGATASGRTGRGKRKASSRQAPNGVYRVVQRLAVERYGRSVFVDFKYVKLNLGVKVWGFVGGGRVKRHGKWVENSTYLRRRVERDQVYPALQFFIKPLDLSGGTTSTIN